MRKSCRNVFRDVFLYRSQRLLLFYCVLYAKWSQIDNGQPHLNVIKLKRKSSNVIRHYFNKIISITRIGFKLNSSTVSFLLWAGYLVHTHLSESFSHFHASWGCICHLIWAGHSWHRWRVWHLWFSRNWFKYKNHEHKHKSKEFENMEIHFGFWDIFHTSNL